MAKLSWMRGRFPDPEVLPTPSFGLNRALNGGLFSGRIHVFWGPKASTKTTAALYMIAEAQRQGKSCAFVDAEKTYNSTWAEMCGVDDDALMKIRANGAESLLELICPALEKGEVDLLVVDSLSSIVFETYFEKPENNAMGTYARSSKFFTHKILNALQHDQQVIFISHAAIDLSGQRPALRAALGNAIEHWASTIVKFQLRYGKSNDRESDGARKVTWRIDKSKTSPYPIEGDYYFMQDEASIDTIAEIAGYAIEEGVVQKGGAWIYYPDKDTCGENRYQGEPRFVAALKEDEVLLKSIKEDLLKNGVSVLDEDDE